jgi:hypothetical protein
LVSFLATSFCKRSRSIAPRRKLLIFLGAGMLPHAMCGFVLTTVIRYRYSTKSDSQNDTGLWKPIENGLPSPCPLTICGPIVAKFERY